MLARAPLGLGLSLVLLMPLAAGAAPTLNQTGCIYAMALASTGVMVRQNDAVLACATATGNAPGGTAPPSAEACITSDADGLLAPALANLSSADASRCTFAPGQFPPFAYAGATSMGNTARSESIQISNELLGTDLDASLVQSIVDPAGAQCQQTLLDHTHRLFFALWQQAIRGYQSGLDGLNRLTGSDPDARIEIATELQAEAFARALADPPSVVAAADALQTETIATCTGVSIGQLFPADCASSASASELATCAEEVARRRYYASIGALLGVPSPCDLTDNGAFDMSCAEPALVGHVLNRIAYGPDAWTLARVDAIGLKSFMEEQLDPDSIDDSAVEADVLARYPSLGMDFLQLRAAYTQTAVPNQAQVPFELREAKLLRAMASRKQLVEVLADFWYNHFNVNGSFTIREWDTTPYAEGLRARVLGRFADNALFVGRAPAMAHYLDNASNRVGFLNENYGRELLELHTLGVEGGYSETDVREAARVLTGWTIDYDQPDGFAYDDALHDKGAKTVIGLSLPPNGGEQEGIDLVEYLSAQRATAEFVCGKLVSYLVDERRPPRLVQHAADVFQATDGDLKAVTEAILFSPEFLLYAPHRWSKVKRPHRLIASTVRALDADANQVRMSSLLNSSVILGEELFAAPAPTGYPDDSAFWASPGNLLYRFNRMHYWANGSDDFVFDLGIAEGTPAQIADALVAKIFPGPVSSGTRSVTLGMLSLLADQSLPTRTKQGLAVVLSNPEFQLH